MGKTTLMEKVVGKLRPRLRLAGFLTSELRSPGGERIGFGIRTLAGREGVLARVGLASRHRVGRYGVNREELERLALPELCRRDVELLVIDEIGKMECASGRFRRAVEDALDSEVAVLATLGIGGSPFFEALQNRPDVELRTLTEGNRDALAEELVSCLGGGVGKS